MWSLTFTANRNPLILQQNGHLGPIFKIAKTQNFHPILEQKNGRGLKPARGMVVLPARIKNPLG